MEHRTLNVSILECVLCTNVLQRKYNLWSFKYDRLLLRFTQNYRIYCWLVDKFNWIVSRPCFLIELLLFEWTKGPEDTSVIFWTKTEQYTNKKHDQCNETFVLSCCLIWHKHMFGNKCQKLLLESISWWTFDHKLLKISFSSF